MDLIAQGAEAKVYKKGSTLIKERVSKSYRVKEIDEKLRVQRTRLEARILEKAAKAINVPKVKKVDELSGKLELEFIEGNKISECLDALSKKERSKVCAQIGKEVGLLHYLDIIHGDLTTSNMILSKKKVFLIDFGLSFVHANVEHKAVDLHLLKQAFESKHWRHFESSLKEVFAAYKKNAKDAQAVLKRLEVVELRGRYKRKGS